jgi:hypothetical protein
LKELYYAGLFGKGTTEMVPVSDFEGVAVSMQESAGKYEAVKNITEPFVERKFIDRGYNPNTLLNVKMRLDYKFAHVLLFHAMRGLVWVYS